jgi:streptogramin lyase
MRKITVVVGAAIVLALGGCGVSRRPAQHRTVPEPAVHAASSAPIATRADAPLQALVTAQTEDRLVITGLPGGRVLRSVTIPGQPGYVDATSRVVVVVSSGSGTITLLARRSLRVIKVFRGFSSPHIPAISPDGRYAYVTDDGTGELAVIDLDKDHLVGTVFVGAGAHHLAFSPDQRRVWIALSQTAQTLTILSTVTPSGRVDLGHPHVVGHFSPPFLAHDLWFSPGGTAIWITSANASYVGVFNAHTHRLLFEVPAGAPPQHLVFAEGYAYITSGYGSSIERVDPFTGRVIKRTYAPYGSFDLDAARGYVVTASLLRGTLAIYDKGLALKRIAQLAPSTEDVALSAP